MLCLIRYPDCYTVRVSKWQIRESRVETETFTRDSLNAWWKWFAEHIRESETFRPGNHCGFRVAPLSDRDAADRELRGFRLLTGYRGHALADIDALEEAVLRISRRVEEVPQIVEIDLNPLFARPPGEGCIVADCRIRVHPHA